MPGDHAITSRTEDKLGRGPFVESLAHAVRQLDASQGAVIGLTGSWGLGKTSVLNMLVEELAREPELVTVSFEPWLFSGTDELIALFFADLSTQLRGKLDSVKSANLIDLLDAYGQSLGVLKWVPVVGPWLDRAGTVANFFNRTARKRVDAARSISGQRARLTTILAAHSDPIVVIVDDLDRLRPQEVRDVFQLVRLTGQFPNLIYVLAFDSKQVEVMLEEGGIDGHAYLEKIIEISYDLPPVPRAALQTVLLGELDALLKRFETGPFHEDRWAEVFMGCIRPLFQDLRDVHRYLAMLPAMLTALGREVAVVDALALEAVRLLQPDVYGLLIANASILTSVTADLRRDSFDQSGADLILEAARQSSPLVRRAVAELLRQLFPATEQYTGGKHYNERSVAQWRRERRVANAYVFAFYLEKVLGPGAASAEVIDRVVAALPNEDELREVMAGVDDLVLEDVLDRLEAYEADFSVSAVEPAASVLLGLYPRLRPHELFDLGGDTRVDRVVLRLLRAVKDQAVLVGIVERVTERQTSLYARMQLLVLVSHLPGGGAKLVSEADSDRLLRQLWPVVRRATAAQLVSEPHLASLLYHAIEDDPSDRATLNEQLGEPPVMAAVLLDTLDAFHHFPMPGMVSISEKPTLRWDTLMMVFGDEQSLKARLAGFKEKADAALLADEGVSLALELAERRLEAGPPSPRWDRPATTSQPISSRSRDILRVHEEADAQLILRTASLYTASKADLERATLISGEVHSALSTHLDRGDMVDAALAYCASRLLPTTPNTSVKIETDSSNHSVAVARRTVTAADSPLAVTLRAAIVAPSPNDESVRVITEVWLARSADDSTTEALPTQSTGTVASIVQVRDLLVGALGTAVDIGASDLPVVYEDNVLPYVATEIHIACGNLTQSQATPGIDELIDLTPLGPSLWTSAPREGDYGDNATTVTGERDGRVGLVNDALRYMARSIWRYAEADARLLTILPSSTR